MCGICGGVGFARPDDAEAVVRRMLAAMHHRGPDDEGLLVAPPEAPRAALGMRRLSIIDLPGGHQPVFNEDRSIAIVFNGEIYNFRELRAELEAAGHCFRTRSDTEAIIHAYEQWSDDCVQHLRGMFAFVVLDLRRVGAGPRVFLARDRLGIKPLYYAAHDGVLLIASEVRALLASRWIEPQLSKSALGAYLLFGSVAEPITLVEGVYSLPPGHRLSVGADAARRPLEPEAYWTFGGAARGVAQPVAGEPQALARELRPVLEDAVRSHLIADVPLGVFLSSGLDSTAIVALASRVQRRLHTFTVVFPEHEFSEAELARAAAERFGTTHQELLLSSEEILARMGDAVAALDQPTMDGINTYFVSWAARQAGLKVALSGLGGDEVFGGYSTFEALPRAERLAAIARSMPGAMRSATTRAVAALARLRLGANPSQKLAALWGNPEALPHPYYMVRALFTPQQVVALRGGTSSSAEDDSLWRAWLQETARQAEPLDDMASVSCLEARTYLVNTLLRDTDSVSMSQSLEVRVPLLDHRLVEFVARLPAWTKQGRGVSKALLVEALGEDLPEKILHQRKRTFTLPWEQWLRGALGEKVAAGLDDLAPPLRSALDAGAVRRVWNEFCAGRTTWSRPWSLYVLNEWTRRHLSDVGLHTEATRPELAAIARGVGARPASD